MNRGIMLLLEVALIVALGVWVTVSLTRTHTKHPGEVEVTVQLSDASDRALLFHGPDGHFRYRIHENNGQDVELTAEELAARIQRDRTSRSLGQRLLNVSSPFGYVWVGLGLLGQVLFTGRMVVQWLVSEKRGKSTVPPAFWWMSLAGSSMLMVYFLWRQDPIGLLGQTFGWFIYIRNIWMIYRPKAPHADAISAAEAAEATEAS